ncbi:hypothetical protein ACHRV5_14710 [Flavobacterium sp. FlaQc-52]|jgi:hypothetical protein|uniref:hypothetical protein n=1 Tax=Flavobacterium sp. FlaQc-52 TaxID=3374185 RepID=UPI003757343B
MYKPKIYYLLLFLSLILTFTNCQTEETTVENGSDIKTVSTDEALEFLKQYPVKTNSQTGKKALLSPDGNHISHEKIINSDQFLTVVPLLLEDPQSNSRLVMLKVNGILKSAVVKMTPDKDIATRFFSGKLFIYKIDGNLITGFKVENGVLVSQYFEVARQQTAKDVEGGTLREVIIIHRYHKSYSLDFASFDWYAAGGGIEASGEIDYTWNSESSGTGSGAGSVVDTYEDPCDKVKKQTTDANFKTQMELLKKNTGLKHETGFGAKKDGSFYPLELGVNGHEVKFPIKSDDIGYMHTHVDRIETEKLDPDGSPIVEQPIKMFSPPDIMKFILLLKNASVNNTPLIDVYGTMVTSSGTYMLKYIGVNNGINMGLNFDDKLIDDYKRYFSRYSDTEKAFLLFVRDKIPMANIELYKIKPDGTAENKTLDHRRKKVTNPCP